MRKTVLIVSALVLSTTGALAADAPQATSSRQACKADVEKLCSGVQPGHGRIAACLKQNESQVSALCTDAVANARHRRPLQAPTPLQGS